MRARLPISRVTASCLALTRAETFAAFPPRAPTRVTVTRDVQPPLALPSLVRRRLVLKRVIHTLAAAPLVAVAGACQAEDLGEHQGLIPGMVLPVAWVFGLGP